MSRAPRCDDSGATDSVRLDEASFVNAVRGTVGSARRRVLPGARRWSARAQRARSSDARIAGLLSTSATGARRCVVCWGAQLLAWLGVVVGVAWIVLDARAVLIDVRVPALRPIPLPTALVRWAF